MDIPYVNFTVQTQAVKAELLRSVEQVLDSGMFILGGEVSAFEGEFAEYCQTRHSVGVSNGTTALYFALRALEIGAGDEVITVPNSFIATASAIALVGARPVLVDIREDHNIDPQKIAAAISPKTKAIMPVHLTGRPAAMNEILEIAAAHKLHVIEDAAQAVGAKLNGKAVSSFGAAGAYSLHPLKNLHAFGDGGMVTTNDEELDARMRTLRNLGLQTRDECVSWSPNGRLDEMQAAMLRVNLRHLNAWTEERRRLAFRYNDELSAVVSVPLEGPGEYCVYQTYVIVADRRDELQQYLLARGIDVKVHYPIPIPLQAAAKELGYSEADFPTAMSLNKKILSLPLYPGLTEEQQGRIIEEITSFYAG